jgi:hypothetical protein
MASPRPLLPSCPLTLLPSSPLTLTPTYCTLDTGDHSHRPNRNYKQHTHTHTHHTTPTQSGVFTVSQLSDIHHIQQQRDYTATHIKTFQQHARVTRTHPTSTNWCCTTLIHFSDTRRSSCLYCLEVVYPVQSPSSSFLFSFLVYQGYQSYQSLFSTEGNK